MEYHKAIDQQKKVEENEMRKAQLSYKIRKGLSQCGETTQAISYREYHTNKLNSQRPFDRPFGNAESTRWYVSQIREWTYSEKEAKEWKAQGLEVFEYDSHNRLVEITNANYHTRKQYAQAGARVKYSYNK